jgi:membrane peptidoglycan carboxypeptidase
VDEIKSAIMRSWRNPDERARGASTITQQLVKNLFLTRERTFSRKAREALITIALEATVPKERLLEVYLNIIEWGPGVYGLGEAAQHYFCTDARRLTPKQAAFLVTLIPNPIKYHVFYERGELTPQWTGEVNKVLGRMVKNGYIGWFEYIRATREPLIFCRNEEGNGSSGKR